MVEHAITMAGMATDRAIGPDVSHHDPVKNWADLVADSRGPSFVGIKATEGLGFVDPKLREHRDGFRASPLLFAVYYHFARSGSARDQAHRLMDAVGPLDPRERLCLDLEVSPAAGAAATLEWVEDFFSELMGNACTDRRPLIYTSDRNWRELVGNLAWNLGTDEVDLWVKRYSESMLEPALPRPWTTVGWTFWQWSDGQTPPSSFNGVGAIDTSYFKGTPVDLADWVQGTGPDKTFKQIS